MLVQFVSPILLLLLLIHALVGYVEMGTDSWIPTITGQIVGNANKNLTIGSIPTATVPAAAGTVQFNNSMNNTYTGSTTVLAGTLALNSTAAGLVAVAGEGAGISRKSATKGTKSTKGADPFCAFCAFCG